MPTNDGDMNPTCRVNIAPPIAAMAAARQNTKILNVGDVVAGEPDAVLLVAHRDQDAAELAGDDVAAQEHAAEQQEAAHEIEDVLGEVGADVPAEQRPQVGDAVDAAGVALPADDQDRHHRGERLRDDGEVDAADPALEHRGAEDEGERSPAPR